MRNKCILFAALLMLSGTISAKVVLPPMFSDNMVLQQQADAPIWGEADENGESNNFLGWKDV